MNQSVRVYHVIRLNTRATSVILSPHIVLILFESENKILYRRRYENSTCKKDKVFKIEIEIWVAKNCQKKLTKVTWRLEPLIIFI